MDPQTLEAFGLGPQTAQPSLDYASLLGYPTPQGGDSALITQPGQVAPTVGGPITQPGQDSGPDNTIPPPELTPITNASIGVGAKVSQSGYSQAANQAIQKGPRTTLDRAAATDEARTDATYKPLVDAQHQATHVAIDAQRQESELEAMKAGVMSEGKQKISAANQSFLEKEQAAMDNAKAESAAGIADYRAALADYAAAKVDPGQLWDQAGAAGQIGMIATAFGHDFLGAKGIKTSGMDSINKAIQNNIDAQIQNMNKKGQVAQGFKQLWDMQRAQSATDGEARQRMNGFYLSALSNQIEANLGGYDSDLARAKGQAAVAALMQAQVKNDLAVQQHIDTSNNQKATNRVHSYAAELSASSARYAADMHYKATELANQKKQADPLASLFIDTSTSGNNEAKRRFFSHVTPADAVESQKQYSKVANTANSIEKLIGMQQQLSKTAPTDVAAFNKLKDEGQRAAEQLRTIVRTNLLYDSSGKAINEQEMKNFDNMVAKKDWWVNGDNTRTLAILAKDRLDKEKDIISGISYEIPPGDPAYRFKTGANRAADSESALFDIQSGPNAGRPQETEIESTVKKVKSPDYNSTDIKAPDEVKGDWNRFLKEDPSSVQETKSRGYAIEGTEPTKAFVGLEHLAELALGGDVKAQREIDKLADKPTGDDAQATLLSAYAQWEQSKVRKAKHGAPTEQAIGEE